MPNTNDQPKSETPRTDAKIKQWNAEHIAKNLDDFDHYFTRCTELAEHARQFERELAEAKAEIEKQHNLAFAEAVENTKFREEIESLKQQLTVLTTDKCGGNWPFCRWQRTDSTTAKQPVFTSEPEHGVGNQVLTFRMAANAIWNKLNFVMSFVGVENQKEHALKMLGEARELADSIVGHPMSGNDVFQEAALAAEHAEKMTVPLAQFEKMKSALRQIADYPIHSEPVGAAHNMQESAIEALK